MRTRLLDGMLFTASVGLGAVAAWGLGPQPDLPRWSMPRLTTPQRVLPPSPPPVQHDLCLEAAPTDWDHEERDLAGRLDALEDEARHAGALPWPWPDDPGEFETPEFLAAELARSRAEDPAAWEGWNVTHDCSEYPCLVVYEPDYVDLDSPPNAFQSPHGISIHHIPASAARLYALYPTLQDPELRRRIDVRVERWLDRLQ